MMTTCLAEKTRPGLSMGKLAESSNYLIHATLTMILMSSRKQNVRIILFKPMGKVSAPTALEEKGEKL
jgi:hypothetical protein